MHLTVVSKDLCKLQQFVQIKHVTYTARVDKESTLMTFWLGKKEHG
jgi:hypothetical protein